MSTFWAVLDFVYPFVPGSIIAWLWAAWRSARAEAIALKSRTDGAIHLCKTVEARSDIHPQARVVAEDIRQWLTAKPHATPAQVRP